MARQTKSMVRRAFRILDEISRAPSGLTLADIVAGTGFAKSTTFLTLAELHVVGAVRHEQDRYFLGPHLATLGGQALYRLDLRTVALPHMQRLVEATGFSSHLGILDQCNVIFIGKVENANFIRFSTYIGMAQPFHLSSLGKAIAAFLPPAELDALLTCPLVQRTPFTITDPSELRSRLEMARQQGYAFEDEEDAEGVRCVGAPIFDAERQVVAAVSVTAVRSSLPVELFSKIGGLVVKAAAAISRDLGYVVDSFDQDSRRLRS